MIDIHSHHSNILVGVDDGPEQLDVALQMFQGAEQVL